MELEQVGYHVQRKVLGTELLELDQRDSRVVDAREVGDEILETRIAEMLGHGDSQYVDAELVEAITEAKGRKL